MFRKSLIISLLLLSINSYAQFRWEQTNGPFGGRSAIIISDTLGNLYGGGDGGIFYSEDNGETWQFNKIDSPMPVISICLAGKDTIYIGNSYNYYRSPDNMKSWEKIERDFGYCSNIKFHPYNGYLFALGYDGLYLSTDKGNTWERKITRTNTRINELKILTSGEVFVGFDYGNIMKSTDFGMTWVNADSGYNETGVTAFQEDKEGNIYAGRNGIYKSTDKGDHWTLYYDNFSNFSCIAFDEWNTFYAGSYNGHLISYRLNDMWRFYTSKNGNEKITSLTSTKDNDVFMYVQHIGLLRSHRGLEWKVVGYPQSRVNDIVIDKKNRVIAATYDNGPYISADMGESWKWLNFNVEWPGVNNVFVTDSNRIILKNANLWVSTDTGWNPWNSIADQFESAIGGFILSNSGKLIINWHWMNYYYSSEDLGKTWIAYGNLGNFGAWNVYEKYPPMNLYISSGSLILVSEDDCNTWHRKELETGEIIWSMKTDRNGILYIGTEKGIYKSRDLNTWFNISSGLPTGKVIAIDTFNDGGIICTMENKGVYLSSNGGANWESFEPTEAVVLKAIADSNGYIFAATEMNSVLKSNIPLKVVSSVKDETQLSYSLLQNYPNPFNPVTTISYAIPSQSLVELKVYDMLGREVTTLVNKEQSAGEYNVQFNASSLPSGVYVYSLKAGEYVNSRKLVLLK